MALHIYTLTSLGERLSHSTDLKKNVNGRVIYHLAFRGQATIEELKRATGASGVDLQNLVRKGVIADVTTVGV